jgi:hypothetical protein
MSHFLLLFFVVSLSLSGVFCVNNSYQRSRKKMSTTYFYVEKKKQQKKQIEIFIILQLQLYITFFLFGCVPSVTFFSSCSIMGLKSLHALNGLSF